MTDCEKTALEIERLHLQIKKMKNRNSLNQDHKGKDEQIKRVSVKQFYKNVVGASLCYRRARFINFKNNN